VLTVQKECNIDIDIEETIAKISPDVMELCAAWCGGKKFVDVSVAVYICETCIIVLGLHCISGVCSEFASANDEHSWYVCIVMMLWPRCHVHCSYCSNACTAIDACSALPNV
jgi:hypothetical protein